LAGVQWQTPIVKLITEDGYENKLTLSEILIKQMNEEVRILERRERKEKGNF